MSTRSAIAIPHGDGWRGRYHHFDGYPDGVGKTLLAIHDQVFEGDLDAMVKYLIEDHTGWSSINGDVDWSAAPGFGGPGPACYCHGDRAEEGWWIECTCPSPESACDPLFIEWAYVLIPSGIFVYDHVAGLSADGGVPLDSSERSYRHRHLGLVPWGDTAAMEAIGRRAYDEDEAAV